MNSTFLSQRHLQDITILTGHDVTLRPWNLDLASHLDGFSEAVDLCSSINATICEDGTNFGLVDAAGVLTCAGQVWAKRVDGLVRAAQLTVARLDDLQQQGMTKKNQKNDANGDKKSSKQDIPHRRSGNPLALTVPDDMKGKGIFLAKKESRKGIANGCVLKDFSRLTPEAYLLQTQPSTLPLLPCERIKEYVDDRGNKTLDWAEFQINTLKMTKEGFFPLGNNGRSPRRESNFWQIFGADRSLRGRNSMNHEDFTEDVGNDHEEVQPVPDVAPPPVFKEPLPVASRLLRSAAVIPLEGAPPFRREISINQLISERSLNTIDSGSNQQPVEEPFRRRKKRVMITRELPEVTPEVGFFMNFWDIHAADGAPGVYLKSVMNRYQWRLKTVVTKQKGVRRKKEEVQIVSVTTDGSDETREDGAVAKVKGGTVMMESDDEDMVVADRENYMEFDEPIGDEDALQLDAATDFFTQMTKDPRRRLSVLPPTNQMEMSLNHSLSEEPSFILPVDLHEWETKLMDFLLDHATNTANFDLEAYGTNMIGKMNSAADSVDTIMATRQSSSGEVCRTFLSVLDLINKNKLELTGDCGQSTGISRDFQQLAVKLHATG